MFFNMSLIALLSTGLSLVSANPLLGRRNLRPQMGSPDMGDLIRQLQASQPGAKKKKTKPVKMGKQKGENGEMIEVPLRGCEGDTACAERCFLDNTPSFPFNSTYCTNFCDAEYQCGFKEYQEQAFFFSFSCEHNCDFLKKLYSLYQEKPDDQKNRLYLPEGPLQILEERPRTGDPVDCEEGDENCETGAGASQELVIGSIIAATLVLSVIMISCVYCCFRKCGKGLGTKKNAEEDVKVEAQPRTSGNSAAVGVARTSKVHGRGTPRASQYSMLSDDNVDPATSAPVARTARASRTGVRRSRASQMSALSMKAEAIEVKPGTQL